MRRSTKGHKDVPVQEPELSNQEIGLTIAVHRHVGPGLLESVYKKCLCLELARAGISFEQEVAVPVFYRDAVIPAGFRADVVVAKSLILEIKTVAAILPVHRAQLLTYLRMSQIPLGLLMNFHAPRLKDGLKRLVV